MEIEKEDLLGAYRGVLQEKRSIESDLAALRLLSAHLTDLSLSHTSSLNHFLFSTLFITNSLSRSQLNTRATMHTHTHTHTHSNATYPQTHANKPTRMHVHSVCNSFLDYLDPKETTYSSFDPDDNLIQMIYSFSALSKRKEALICRGCIEK